MLEKKAGEFSGEKVIAEFERLTRDADNVQRETLRRILAENGDTEYLRGLGLAGRTDAASFKECVPLATHADLEPYIERIVDGDATPVLTGKPVTSISLSSGTTQGKRKYLLFNEELVKSTMQIYRTSYAFRNREFPVEDGKALQFIYSSRQFTTKGGLTATTATTNVYRSEEFKATMRAVQSQCCSPDEVIFGADFAQSLYCHLLCGLLAAGEVQMVSATFAHSVVLAFQTFERVWEELCADIRRGALSPTRVTSPAVRQAVSALLAGPNPELADAVARRCAGLSNWYGVIPALWPNAKYVYGIMTGSMEHYVKKLRHYAGELPLVAAEYGASEGWIGANVEPAAPPESATFTVLPDIGYFEFIPLRPGCTAAPGPDACYGESEPVGLTDVVVGEHYEVVMTTFAGLYRYRLGDVVRVAGFHNATPKLKFVCRRNLALSINIDKNSEQDLQLAVDAAAAKFLAAEKLEVVDYTSHADMSSDPGHYVVFVELNAAAADASADALQGCCDELDRAFADPGYVGSRRSRAIGPLELRVLQRGTFHRVLRHYLSLGAPVSQFKSPRCVARSNAGVLQILAACTAKAFFSAAYD
ncbi:jasmonoyl--L-amino acid synthetase GH3.3 [Aegilops tauschii subsp. strangulata]|uniref:Indole-3-acetic acid-amido synthetase GH3.5 n=1 Tax=Aegilops tauschii subsp. strangulata TaxID=200361 RepID=A0A453EFW9_AEGTS|nr:jasmonoyl--L-amino acid synthetase GH3.3 [Aegilops tauschii subsp. strangulata]